MAYMRDPVYIYSDGTSVHFHQDHLPERVLEQLAVMVVARLEAEGRLEEVERETIAEHQGDFGCDALCKKYNLDGVMDIVGEIVKAETGKDIKEMDVRIMPPMKLLPKKEHDDGS